MEEKKRYNLGVLIGGVHTYFPKEHIKGISEAAAELDVKMCIRDRDNAVVCVQSASGILLQRELHIRR